MYNFKWSPLTNDFTEAQIKRRTSQEPNSMQIRSYLFSKIYMKFDTCDVERFTIKMFNVLGRSKLQLSSSHIKKF